MENMTLTLEQKSIIKEAYHKYFKDSAVIFTNPCMSSDYVYVDFYCAENAQECPNGYLDNDMFKFNFTISRKDETYAIKASCTPSYLIKPESHFLAYGRRKIIFRGMAGDFTKLIKKLEDFFKKVSISCKEDLQNNLISEQDYYKEVSHDKVLARHLI